MIASFGDSATEDPFNGRRSSRVRRFPASIRVTALEKLDVLNAAGNLQDLRSPPGNRLEVLRGDLRGFHGVRVNRRWRIVFRWVAGEANDVRLVDYHS